MFKIILPMIHRLHWNYVLTYTYSVCILQDSIEEDEVQSGIERVTGLY